MKKITVNLVSEFSKGPKAHGLYVAFQDAVKLAKTFEEVEVFINSNKNTDIIHSHDLFPYYLYKIFGKKSKKILTLHVIPDSFAESFALYKYWKPLFKKYLRYVCNRSDMVICVAPLEKKKLIKLGVETRIEVIPNYINIDSKLINSKDRQLLRSENKINPNQTLVIGVGQMIARKGIFEFLETAKNLPEIKFVWIGGLPYKADILSYHGSEIHKAIKKAPKNIIFTGVLDREEVFRWYNAADILLFASHQEIHPLVVIEAAFFGLPLIMKDIQEYKDIFFDNFFKANTPPEIIKAIKTLISNKDILKNYQLKSKKIAGFYSQKTIGQKILSLYKELAHQE